MPRGRRKKGFKQDGEMVVQTKQNGGITGHTADETFIEGLQKDHPYWIKEGNKLTCSHCHISFNSSAPETFKIEVSFHMESKPHKIKIGTYIAEDDHGKKTKVAETNKQNEKEFTHKNKSRNKQDGELVDQRKQNGDFTGHPGDETFIEELQKDHSYWIKKGNKLTCSLCHISFHFSTLAKFKTEVSSHMESKHHKIKIGTCIAGDDHGKKTKIGETSKQNEQEFTQETKNSSPKLLDMVKDIEYHLSVRKSLTDKNMKCDYCNSMIDLETVYRSLQKVYPGKHLQMSRKFISKAKDGRNYFCEICQEPIFASQNANECRYNLWTHINDERHREILPKNRSKEEKKLSKRVQELSKEISADLTGDLKYFEIGPVYRFFKCSLCNVVVSENPHRLEKHIISESHQNNKKKELKEYTDHSKTNHIRYWFIRFMENMGRKLSGSQFKEVVEHIQVGKMPGYVVCSLCSVVVLPTDFYLNEHFKSDNHVKNKAPNLVKLESTFKNEQIKTLEGNLIDCSAFEKNIYGITCRRCDVFMPPTSYILYCHIRKSGCVHIGSDREAVK